MKDSKKCDHIYVVMSVSVMLQGSIVTLLLQGSCHVVKRFIDNTAVQSKAHQRSLTSECVIICSCVSSHVAECVITGSCAHHHM